MAEDGARLIPFEGIDAPNTTPVPDVYFDVLFPRLGKGALKVLLYLVRRIFGFKKEGDAVSLSQICSGIRRRDGTILDRGTGLSRHAAASAIRELEELGVIVATRGISTHGDPAPTYYALRFREQLSVQDLLRQGSPSQAGYRFPGIDSPNTTPVPDAYFDLLLPELGLAEWRVLLYVIRRTLGFKKLSDAISLDQFTAGIVTHAGSRLDAGTGLSRSNVHEALNRLVMRNVLTRQRVRDARSGDGVSIFSLAMREDVRQVMGTTLGMAPGPLLEAPTNEPVPLGVPQHDYLGGLPEDYRGVPQSDYQGVPPTDHPRVLPGNRRQSAALKAEGMGVPLGDHPGVPRSDYQGALRSNHPESRYVPAGGDATEPPVGRVRTPQQTDPQQTDDDNIRKRDGGGGPYEAIVRQIATDLGVPAAAAAYGTRVADLAAGHAQQAPDFYEALLAAWKLTRAKVAQQALTRPDAAMAYFYSVLSERASIRPTVMTPAPRPAESLQDERFLDQLRQRAGRLGDQQGWRAILQGLLASMTRANYTRWFARSAALDDDEALVVVVADVLQRDWLATRLYPVIQREARERGEERSFRFVTLTELHP